MRFALLSMPPPGPEQPVSSRPKKSAVAKLIVRTSLLQVMMAQQNRPSSSFPREPIGRQLVKERAHFSGRRTASFLLGRWASRRFRGTAVARDAPLGRSRFAVVGGYALPFPHLLDLRRHVGRPGDRARLASLRGASALPQ